MRSLIISFFALSMIIFSSCNIEKNQGFTLEVLQHKYYDNLSSASGVSMHNEKIIIVGDDIPWLIEMDNVFSITDTIILSGIDSIVNGRTPYLLKADYENMETFDADGKTFTVVLSSGSKINSRDTAILISYQDSVKIQKQNIRPLFEKIKTNAGMRDEEINIEGLAVSMEKVYLFHRGNISGNFIAELNKDDFLHFLQTGHYHHAELNIFPFNLPELNGIRSGFSGACYLADYHSFLFTASMEDTKSVTADGVVSGSYIGIIPLGSINEGKYRAALLKSDKKIVIKKLEGICIKNIKENEIELITVSDNDDGSSDIFLIKMNVNE